MPDLSNHNSIMADTLKKDPSIYAELKDLKTDMGVGLARCIKTGMDNRGHPMIKTCGIVAGDEDSYKVFAKLFDPIIDIRHGGYAADAVHPTDMDVEKLSSTAIDPTGEYIISTRVRTGRSVRGSDIYCLYLFWLQRYQRRIVHFLSTSFVLRYSSSSRMFKGKPS